MNNYSFNSPRESSSVGLDFSQSKFPWVPLSQEADMLELAKPKPKSVTARGRGKGKKRSLVRPPSMPNLGQSFFGSFDDFEPEPELQPKQAKETAIPLTRRRTMANMEELRPGLEQEEFQGGREPGPSVADWTEQLVRLEETSSLMASEGFPEIVLEGFTKVWAYYKAVTHTSRDKVAAINQAVQLSLDASVASRAELERKYRELEDLEEKYKTARIRTSSSSKD